MDDLIRVAGAVLMFLGVFIVIGVGLGVAVVMLLLTLRLAGIQTGFWDKP